MPQTETLIIHHANSIQPVPISDLQAAYLAGLIDGEGYIGISRAFGNKSAKSSLGPCSYRLNLAVAMTNSEALAALREWTGVGVISDRRTPKGGNRPVQRWSAWANQAAAVLLAIQPHVLVKRPQVDLAIEFQQMMRRPGRFGLTDTEWSERERLAAAIASHNHTSSTHARKAS